MFKWVRNSWKNSSIFGKTRIILLTVLAVYLIASTYAHWDYYTEWEANRQEVFDWIDKMDMEEMRRELLREEGAIDV